MPKGIIGTKLGMTQLFDADGNVIAVTVVKAGPCSVIKKKTSTGKDGYSAILMGYGEVRSCEFEGETVYKANKPALGLFKGTDITPKINLIELRIWEEDLDKYEVGDTINADAFNPGDVVDVIGKSKGHGFTGVMKRHGMHGYKATHGTHEYKRHGGSIGMSATPSHTAKGKRMPGQDGNSRVTVQNVRVVEVDKEKNLILIRGGIPGPNGAIVVIQDAVKLRRRPRM